MTSRKKTDRFAFRNTGLCGHFTKFSDHVLVSADGLDAFGNVNDDGELANWRCKCLNNN